MKLSSALRLINLKVKVKLKLDNIELVQKKSEKKMLVRINFLLIFPLYYLITNIRAKCYPYAPTFRKIFVVYS